MARLELKNSRKQKHSESWYYMIATTRKGWQVLRHFVVDMDIRKGGSPYYSIHEAVQNWIDKQGKRIETIEIDLKTFKVVQSRGVWNKNTDKHDEIMKLVRDNINLIKQVA